LGSTVGNKRGDFLLYGDENRKRIFQRRKRRRSKHQEGRRQSGLSSSEVSAKKKARPDSCQLETESFRKRKKKKKKGHEQRIGWRAIT